MTHREEKLLTVHHASFWLIALFAYLCNQMLEQIR